LKGVLDLLIVIIIDFLLCLVLVAILDLLIVIIIDFLYPGVDVRQSGGNSYGPFNRSTFLRGVILARLF
jgi:hypothetical protein